MRIQKFQNKEAASVAAASARGEETTAAGTSAGTSATATHHPPAQSSSGGHKATTTPQLQTQGNGEQKTMFIAVMGVTGAGKSKFVNTLTGSNTAVEGHQLESFTKHTSTHLAIIGSQRVMFVDTPGFNDSCFGDTAILRQVTEWLCATYSSNMHVSGLIYLHRITDNRLSGTALRCLHIFQALCGDAAMANVMLFTTHWDTVDEAQGLSRETELREKFWKVMIDKGAQMGRFNANREDTLEFIEPMFSRLSHIGLRIQDQMVNKGMTLHETDAGRVVAEGLQNAENNIQREVDTLQLVPGLTPGMSDPEVAKMMEEEKGGKQRALEDVRQERQQLSQETEEDQEMREEIVGLVEQSSSMKFWAGVVGTIATGLLAKRALRGLH